jgi:hypothetical protein
MSNRAKITSVEALETFRTNLIVYLSKARPTLDEVGSDVNRIRTWLENEQRTFWEGQLRRRNKQLQEAQQALFSAEISGLREATMVERLTVNKAKRAVDEAEAKLKLIKRWSREFNNHVEPIARQLGKLQSLLTTEMPNAVAYLGKAAQTLNEYADVSPSPQPQSPVETQEPKKTE